MPEGLLVLVVLSVVSQTKVNLYSTDVLDLINDKQYIRSVFFFLNNK